MLVGEWGGGDSHPYGAIIGIIHHQDGGSGSGLVPAPQSAVKHRGVR